MIFVHSFSSIEQQLYKRLAEKCQLTQFDIRSINSQQDLERLQQFEQHKVLIYSFQRLDLYRHLDSFRREIAHVTTMIAHIKKAGFEKIVLLSYPGAYAASDNLFLQHKGIIEQLFASSGIACTTLRVQGICSPPQQLHNFHHLFYNTLAHQYIIPRKAAQVVYSIQLNHLAEIVAAACQQKYGECFDVFDKVSSLKNFLMYNSHDIPVKTIPAMFLYFQSYCNKYIAPTMFELFLRAAVPMYNFRTEKTFNISLHAEMFSPIGKGQTKTEEDDFMISMRRKLVPVS